MDIRNLIGGTVFLLLSVFILIYSLGLGIGTLYNPQAGFMPAVVSLLILVFSLILVSTALRNRSRRVRLRHVWQTPGWKKSMMVAGSIALYVLALSSLGYLPATFGLMTLVLLINRIRWWVALSGAAGLAALSWGLFYGLLNTPLPQGIWGF